MTPRRSHTLYRRNLIRGRWAWGLLVVLVAALDPSKPVLWLVCCGWVAWDTWMSLRDPQAEPKDEPPRLPRRVRKRRGLPRNPGTEVPADPAAYQARKAAERAAAERRRHQLEEDLRVHPWRRGLPHLERDAVHPLPGTSGAYRVGAAGQLWVWEGGNWQPLGDTRDVTLHAPPEREIRAYRVAFFVDADRPNQERLIELTHEGVLPLTSR